MVGGTVYPLLELCWRRRTHVTMSLAGGLSLCWLRLVHKRYGRKPLWRQAVAGGLGVTAIELMIGLCFNRRHRIWDYRRMPLNLRGQICAPFTLAWCGLSALALTGMRLLRR